VSTIVMVHRKENLKKCSVWPLRTREDFRFHLFPYDVPLLSVNSVVRLGIGTPLLSEKDAGKDLLVLDATWRLASQMERPFLDIPIRSLPQYKTAYPRVAGDKTDPEYGLATVEAIYCAHRILGWDITDLLAHYRWEEDFLSINDWS
jgi:pre-rRNA-processing protein TSR3